MKNYCHHTAHTLYVHLMIILFIFRKYEKGTCVAIAGSGKEENRNNRYPMMASFAQPSGLTYSRRLKAVFIADCESSSIRKLSLEDGCVSHVVGADKNPDVSSCI